MLSASSLSVVTVCSPPSKATSARRARTSAAQAGVETCARMQESIWILQRGFDENLWSLTDRDRAGSKTLGVHSKFFEPHKDFRIQI